MAEIIRAVYEQGRLRPLDPLPLTDGQEICLAVLSEREQARAALADMLAPIDTEPAAEIDAVALLAADAALQGHPPVSDAIPNERREGPWRPTSSTDVRPSTDRFPIWVRSR